jgi:hypothetical protein
VVSTKSENVISFGVPSNRMHSRSCNVWQVLWSYYGLERACRTTLPFTEVLSLLAMLFADGQQRALINRSAKGATESDGVTDR